MYARWNPCSAVSGQSNFSIASFKGGPPTEGCYDKISSMLLCITALNSKMLTRESPRYPAQHPLNSAPVWRFIKRVEKIQALVDGREFLSAKKKWSQTWPAFLPSPPTREQNWFRFSLAHGACRLR